MIRRLAFLPAVLWAALIVTLSSRPTLPVPLPSGTDKIAHFAAYAVLGFLLALALPATRRATLAGIAMGLAFALSDEWHQAFVPGRAAEAGDWIADALGIVAGIYLLNAIRTRRPGRDLLAPAVRTDIYSS